MKRLIASLLGIAMVIPTIFIAPVTASADTVTGPWLWTDLSSQLTTRTNRPVWSIAYSNGSWFYTDGQELWNGGNVYRYDGHTQTNITPDIRNAGLSRVDDIVSNGNTVLFLQDVVRTDNQLSIVAYRNGQYLNITSQVRGMLQSNEGVNSIQGRNGSWYAFTNRGRLFRLNDTGVATQITLPNAVQNLEGTRNTLRYNVNHGSKVDGADRVPVAMVPVTNDSWLLVADPDNGPVRFYRYNNTSFTDITSQFPHTDRITKVASNGHSAFLMGTGSNGTWTRLANGNGTVDIYGLGNINDETRVFWNGKSWMILQNKEMYRVNGSFVSQTVERYSRVADLFLQGASDNNGRLLLGGAQSNTWTNDPSHPLTAKLVMVSEGVAAPRVLGTTTSVGGPTINIYGNPSDFRIGNGNEFAYRVDATDPNGVSRIDLFVNDALIRTCLSETSCEYRTQYWTNGATTRSVKFQARATDTQGNITVSRTDFLTVDMNSNAGTNGNTGNGNGTTNGSIWTWSEPNQTTLNNNQSIRFHVSANDADGLDRIEIIANSNTVRTCTFGNVTGNRECDWTIYANNYSNDTSVFVNAKATDRYGNTVWSNGTTFYRSNNGNNGNNNQNNPPQTDNQKNPAVWDWLEPSDNTLDHANDWTDYRMGAWDEDGLDRIEIVVNGTVRRTCDFNNATGNRECSWRIHANDYTSGSDVFVNAKATDRYGNVSWTSGKTVRIEKDSNGQNNGNAAVAIYASHTTYNWGDKIAFTGYGEDQDGVDRVEFYVNGNKAKTCYGNGACRFIMGPFFSNSDIRYSATVVDRHGNKTKTDDKWIRTN